MLSSLSATLSVFVFVVAIVSLTTLILCTSVMANSDLPLPVATFDLMKTSGDDWVLANLGVVGYYRVNYDQDNWEKLLSALSTNHEVWYRIIIDLYFLQIMNKLLDGVGCFSSNGDITLVFQAYSSNQQSSVGGRCLQPCQVCSAVQYNIKIWTKISQILHSTRSITHQLLINDDKDVEIWGIPFISNIL